MARTVSPYDDITQFLPLIHGVMRKRGIFAGRVLTEDDFVQAGYLGLIQHWQRYGKDQVPAPSYSLIVFREMIEALRMLGIRSKRLVNEPLIMDDAYAAKIVEETPDLSVSRAEEARRFDYVIQLLNRLPPKEKMVMRAILLHGVTQKQLMGRLHVSEGRVSQIRARAVRRLRKMIVSENAQRKKLCSTISG